MILSTKKNTKSSDDYDDKFMKIKFTSDDELPLNRTIEIPSMTIVVRVFFFLRTTNIIHKFFLTNVCIKYKNGK